MIRSTLLILVSLLAGRVLVEDPSTPASPSTSSTAPAHLRLIPYPKHVALAAGEFSWSDGARLLLSSPTDADDRFSAEVLRREVEETLGVRAEVDREADRAPEALRSSHAILVGRLPVVGQGAAEASGPEGYVLHVTPEGILVRSTTSRGLRLGVQTLRQLVRSNARGRASPCVTIEDWPVYGIRSFSDDITRGPSPTLEFLKREVDLASLLKLNGLTYYLEDQFFSEKHPDIGPDGGRLLPEELRQLVRHASERHVEVIGNQQSFGHFAKILAVPAYRRLAETPDVLSPALEDSYRLLEDLYAAQMSSLESRLFNVCCDEVGGLGSGPARKLVEELGPGRVYARHIRRVHDLVTGKFGKQMLMWGDIALSDPVILEEIPRDIILVNWAYDNRPSFESQIEPFVRAGFRYLVAPGTSCWSRILPDFQVAAENIFNFCRDGARHGALGVLNTTWDDDGENLFLCNMHGILWGAECSWNGGAADRERFDRSFGPVLFGTKDDAAGRAVGLLSKAHRLPGYDGMLDPAFWRKPGDARWAPLALGGSARRLQEITNNAVSILGTARAGARWNVDALDALLHGARRMAHMAMRDLSLLDAARTSAGDRGSRGGACRKAAATFEDLRKDLLSLRDEYRRLYLIENRPYFLDRNLGLYDTLATEYARLKKALSDAAAAPTPPAPPEVIGVSALGDGLSGIRPARAPAGEKADWAGPWAVPGASLRIPVRVEAGDLPREELPVEVALDEEVIRGAAPDSIACAEVDPAGRTRLLHVQGIAAACGLPSSVAWKAPGAIPPGEQRLFVLYFGGNPAATPEGDRVTVRREGGGFWAENGAARILVGPDGAHVDRWHVKALGDIEITEEGDGSWHGFSDQGSPIREFPHEVRCIAGGPVVARFAFLIDDMPVKLISLPAGASWVEVRLAGVADYYWDFDRTSNFAADAPLPGQAVFSTGKTAPIPSSRELVQVAEEGATWGAKYRADGLTLALLRLDAPGAIRVGPGGGWGGCGIERSEPTSHFVTFAGKCEKVPPVDLLSRLRDTLDGKRRPRLTVYPEERREGR